MRIRLIFLFTFLTLAFARAQEIKIEFDRKNDLTHYQTFRFGEGQIITPQDQRVVPDATIHKWVRNAITEELTEKGLKKVDSAGDLVVSYLTGTENRSNAGSVGPLGMTPGSNTQTYMRDYQQGSLVIDLNDTKNKILIWRVKATTDTNLPEAQASIEQIVEHGFKKFSLKPRKQKKKK